MVIGVWLALPAGFYLLGTTTACKLSMLFSSSRFVVTLERHCNALLRLRSMELHQKSTETKKIKNKKKKH